MRLPDDEDVVSAWLEKLTTLSNQNSTPEGCRHIGYGSVGNF
jgi:hypothetical protein